MRPLSTRMAEYLVRIGLAKQGEAFVPRRTARALMRRRLVKYADHGLDLFVVTARGRAWLERWREGEERIP